MAGQDIGEYQVLVSSCPILVKCGHVSFDVRRAGLDGLSVELDGFFIFAFFETFVSLGLRLLSKLLTTLVEN